MSVNLTAVQNMFRFGPLKVPDAITLALIQNISLLFGYWLKQLSKTDHFVVETVIQNMSLLFV